MHHQTDTSHTPDIVVEHVEALAALELQDGHYEKALAVYRKLTELRPLDPSYWTLLGIAGRKTRRFHYALAAFEQALDIDAHYGPALVNAGEVLICLKRFEEGTRLLRQVFENGYQPEKPPSQQDDVTRRAGVVLASLREMLREFVCQR